MSNRMNRQIVLAARPQGEPKESDFRLVETPVPEPGPGQMLLRTLYLSLDPYMRGRMNAGPSYAPPVEIGQVMGGGTVSPGRSLAARRIPARRHRRSLHRLGGVRAFRRARRPQARSELRPGDHGARRAGDAGDDRLDRPDEHRPAQGRRDGGGRGGLGRGRLGGGPARQDQGMPGRRDRRRRAEMPVRRGGARASTPASTTAARTSPRRSRPPVPKGIDVYFENVGGPVFDAVLPLLNTFARVPVCGLIAHYNDTELPEGPDRVPLLMRQVLVKRLTLRGFIVFDFANQQTGLPGRGRPAGPRRPDQVPRAHRRRPGERPARPDRAPPRRELRQGDRPRRTGGAITRDWPSTPLSPTRQRVHGDEADMPLSPTCR